MCEFDIANQSLIGKSGADHVAVEITNRSLTEPWLRGSLDIKAGPWSGRFLVSFHKGELRQFALEIEKLYRDLVGPAELNTMEQNLRVGLSGDAKGRIVLEGRAQDSSFSGTHLVFRFEMDQTELPAIAASLRTADPV
jgi:hypothetical protein